MLLRRLARPMLAATFIWGGINVLRSPAGHAEAAKPVLDAFGPEDRPADETMVKIDAGVKIVAGSMLAFGKFPRLASTALAASLVPTTLAAHRFWEESDPEVRSAQQVQFLKNAGLLGGLLIAAADTEAKPSLGWRARRAARRAGESAQKTSHLATDLAAGLAGAVSVGGSGLQKDLQKKAVSVQKAAAATRAELEKRASEVDVSGMQKKAATRAASVAAEIDVPGLQKKAAKRAAAVQKAAAAKASEIDVSGLQKKAAKRAAAVQKAAAAKASEIDVSGLQKKAAKQAAALQKAATATRAEIEKKAPEVLEQASRLGHDLAARAAVVGTEVAHQAEGAAKDARKRLATLSS